jgi:NADH dehydrogenase (ubiquinone) 1 beta subcomplex subunit 8
MGVFSLEEYTHTTPSMAIFQIGCFISAVLALCGVTAMLYPDKPSVPREFEGGLDRELGGPGAVRVCSNIECHSLVT